MRHSALRLVATLAAFWFAASGEASQAQFQGQFQAQLQTESQPQSAPPAVAQSTDAGPNIVWEVKNRFRLFRQERDFQLHAAALQGRSILASEQLMALDSEGRGWARNMFNRLCIDALGRIPDQCERDGTRESYLAPTDFRVGVRIEGSAPDATCAWSFDDGQGPPQTVTRNCAEEIGLRVREGQPTVASVDVNGADGNMLHSSVPITVRDLLIAGLGDSVASGEGDPDRAVALSDDGFCFRQFLSGESSAYFRPGRAGFKGDKSCDDVGAAGSSSQEWTRLSARWMNAACHRSLYSYQVRAALALAVETPHAAVTFVPLACTGATIESGLFAAVHTRELDCGDAPCPSTIPGQIAELQNVLAQARRSNPSRQFDLVFLTIGANDVHFAGLLAGVIIDRRAERSIFTRAGIILGVDTADSATNQILPGEFVKLRAALKPFVGGNLNRVVYVSYGNPALAPDGSPCPGGREGFDVHPAFNVNAERLQKAVDFVQNRFLPRLKALATCTGDTICADPSHDRMSFADAHQAAFAAHGICAHAETDPDFDKECFSATGESFTTSLIDGANDPLVCERPASEFRAYAPRARWIRTANDSYFTAMTYPEGIASIARPRDIHDATWGILSAVYGGAVHPTAEGQAAMADAALPEARRVLGLGESDTSITGQPLPAPEPETDAR